MEERKKDPSYEWVTLRETNIHYISSVTGISKPELKTMLEEHAKRGIYEIKLPLGVKVFTRNER